MMAKKAIFTAAPAEAVSFVPSTDFTEYPFGPDEPVQFRGGIPSPTVPAEFVERMRTEGKVSEPAADTAPDQPDEG